jgi:hypothetical protein
LLETRNKPYTTTLASTKKKENQMSLESMFRGNQQRVSSRRDLISTLKDYFDIALFSKLKSDKTDSVTDKLITNNRTFWNEALNRNLHAGQIVKLSGFKILEWIPTSPGLFHTSYAVEERDYAMRRHYENEKKQGKANSDPNFIELRPGDKRSMVKGGVGSLRLGPKKVGGNIKHIMCATSSGISHEGIVLFMENEHYEKVISEIKDKKNPSVDLTGRIMLLPDELSLINFQYHKKVPKYYIEVEELEMIKNETPNQGVVSVAITYTREDKLKDYDPFSFSFCQFSPTQTPANLEGVTDWLRDYAVKYSESKTPMIVGDFDEYYDHFEKVQFPIADIANGMISIEKLHQFQHLFEFNINETTMGDKNIFNNSQIGAVGSKAKATKNKFQQNNYTIPEDINYDSLIQELTKLKDNLKSNANSPEEFKAISEVVEAENAAKEKNGNKVVQHLLNGGKWVLNTAKDIGVGVIAELINKQMI